MTASDDFVRAWQAEHPAEVFVLGWRCPLCDQVVQTATKLYTFNWTQEEAVVFHQQAHGVSWHAYQALAETAGV